MTEAFAPDEGAWIEASRPLRPGTPVWPGDRPFELIQHREPGLVVSSYCSTCHAGTHVDAALHFDPSGGGVETVPTDVCIGPAELLRVGGGSRALVPADMPAGWKPRHPRVLFRTDSYPLDGIIDGTFSGLSGELVHWLADHGVELVGIDTPSVDLFDDARHPAHHALLERGLTWIENLWLGDAEPGSYLLVALPILLEGAEAAPVRAVLKKLGG